MNCSNFYGSQKNLDSSSESDDNDSDYDAIDELLEYTYSESSDGNLNRTLNDGQQSNEEQDVTVMNDDILDESCELTTTNDSMWKEVSSSARSFACTATERRNYHLTPENEDAEIHQIDLYKLFVSNEVIDLIVEETNRYYDFCMEGTSVTRHSKLKQWKYVTRKDIEEFLGVSLQMGLNQQPTYVSYWSKSKMYGVEMIQNTMSRNKFELILRFLHFANNEEADVSDRLCKLRPLISMLSLNFEKFTPGEKVVIDESLVHFRGRTILRQYIPNKAHKYGLEFYKLCDVNGYTWRFIIYKGKGDLSNEFSHSEYITLQLMEGLLREGRTLYVDNFYSSVVLAKTLLDKSTYVCGTLRSNRRFIPKEVTSKKLKKGEVVGKQSNDGIKVMKWKDKRDVLRLTTVPEHTAELSITRDKKNDRDVMKPQCVFDYNDAKKGVDYSDQMSSYYSPLRKTKKWYKKAAFELLLGTSVVNACILYNKYHTQKPMPIKAFRESLILHFLTGKSNENLAIGREKCEISETRSEHSLVEMPGKSRETRKRCS